MRSSNSIFQSRFLISFPQNFYIFAEFSLRHLRSIAEFYNIDTLDKSKALSKCHSRTKRPRDRSHFWNWPRALREDDREWFPRDSSRTKKREPRSIRSKARKRKSLFFPIRYHVSGGNFRFCEIVSSLPSPSHPQLTRSQSHESTPKPRLCIPQFRHPTKPQLRQTRIH